MPCPSTVWLKIYNLIITLSKPIKLISIWCFYFWIDVFPPDSSNSLSQSDTSCSSIASSGSDVISCFGPLFWSSISEFPARKCTDVGIPNTKFWNFLHGFLWARRRIDTKEKVQIVYVLLAAVVWSVNHQKKMEMQKMPLQHYVYVKINTNLKSHISQYVISIAGC